MTKKPIYLFVQAGVPNYGDELIPVLWLDYLTHKFPDRHIFVDALNPGNATNLFGWKYPNVHFVDTLHSMVNELTRRGIGFFDSDPIIDDWLATGRVGKYDSGLKLLQQAEVIHFVGGGYMNTAFREFRGRLKAVLIASRMKVRNPDLKLIATGLGLTPFDDKHAAKLNTIIPQFDYFEVRDDESALAVQAQAGLDDMFMTFSDTFSENGWGVKFNKDVPRVNILLQRDLQNGEALQRVVEQIKTYVTENYSPQEPLSIVEGLAPNDGWAVQAFSDLPNPVQFYSVSDVIEEGFPAAPESVWLTTRFHFHMIGASLGAKGTFINTGGAYYDVKHGSLVRLGTGWHNYALTGDMTVSVDDAFPEKARAFGNQKYALAERLYGGLE
jgi:hypothetical protein